VTPLYLEDLRKLDLKFDKGDPLYLCQEQYLAWLIFGEGKPGETPVFDDGPPEDTEKSGGCGKTDATNFGKSLLAKHCNVSCRILKGKNHKSEYNSVVNNARKDNSDDDSGDDSDSSEETDGTRIGSGVPAVIYDLPRHTKVTRDSESKKDLLTNVETFQQPINGVFHKTAINCNGDIEAKDMTCNADVQRLLIYKIVRAGPKEKWYWKFAEPTVQDAAVLEKQSAITATITTQVCDGADVNLATLLNAFESDEHGQLSHKEMLDEMKKYNFAAFQAWRPKKEGGNYKQKSFHDWVSDNLAKIQKKYPHFEMMNEHARSHSYKGIKRISFKRKRDEGSSSAASG